MLGLHPADWLALGLYLVLIMAIGVWSSRYVTGTAEFVMPRRFGKLMMVFHSFGTSTHSDQAVTVASKSYSSGLSGIWYQWLWLFATPFFWLIAPMMRRFRALTTADVFRLRYDQSVAVLFAVFGLMKFVVTIGTMLKGASVVIEACTLGRVPAEAAVLVMTVLFVVYGLAGGLGAAIITDFIQGVLTLAFSFLLLPLVLDAVGGLSGLRETIPSVTGREDMLSLVTPGEIGVFYIAVISLNSLIGVVVQPHNMGTTSAGRTETEGAVGFMGGTFIKRICTVAWSLTGLAAVVYYGNSLEHPDLVYGQMAREFLPTIMPGLVGVFLAGLLATVMGSCDSFMISASGLMTENCYKVAIPGKSDRHYLGVARLAAAVVVVGGVLFAYWAENVIEALEVLWKINTMMGPAFWLGLFWRRTTVAGAWAATLCTVGTWWLTTWSPIIAWLGNLPAAETLAFVTGDGTVYLPWQMVFYLTAGFLGGIVVSLVTPRVNAGQLSRYYALLRTPVRPGEQVETPCTLPAGAEVPPPRELWPQSDLFLPRPTGRAIAGFLAGWVIVASIIGTVWLWIAE